MVKRVFVPVEESLFKAIGSKSRWNDVVRAGNTLWVTGQLGWDKTTGVFAETFEGQVELALENLKGALERAGATLADVVLTRVYLVDHDHYHRYEPDLPALLPRPPAGAGVGGGGGTDPSCPDRHRGGGGGGRGVTAV